LHILADDKLKNVRGCRVLYPQFYIQVIRTCFGERRRNNNDQINHHLSPIKALSLWSLLESYNTITPKVRLQGKNRNNYREKSGKKINSSPYSYKVNFHFLEDSRYKRKRERARVGEGKTQWRWNLFARTRCQGLPETNFNFDTDSPVSFTSPLSLSLSLSLTLTFTLTF